MIVFCKTGNLKSQTRPNHTCQTSVTNTPQHAGGSFAPKKTKAVFGGGGVVCVWSLSSQFTQRIQGRMVHTFFLALK
jgi:hypothetical protein